MQARAATADGIGASSLSRRVSIPLIALSATMGCLVLASAVMSQGIPAGARGFAMGVGGGEVAVSFMALCVHALPVPRANPEKRGPVAEKVLYIALSFVTLIAFVVVLCVTLTSRVAAGSLDLVILARDLAALATLVVVHFLVAFGFWRCCSKKANEEDTEKQRHVSCVHVAVPTIELSLEERTSMPMRI